MNGNEMIGSFEPDFLIYDSKVPTDTETVYVEGGQGILPRGAVIGFDTDEDDDPGVLWGSMAGVTATGILCDEVDTGESGGAVVAHIYRKGHFCRQALVIAEGETLTKKAERELQSAGIYLSNGVN